MRVKVRTRERCAVCGGKFTLRTNGLICQKHPTIKATKFYLDWNFHGENFRLYGFDSFKAAFTKAASIDYEIENFKFRPESYRGYEAKINKKFIFADRFNKWTAFKKKEVAPSYFRKIEQYHTEFIDFFGKEDIRLIGRDRIMDYYESLLEKVSVKTQYNKLGLLHTFFKDMYEREAIIAVPRFPKVKLQKRQVKWLQKPEQLRILSEIPEEHRPIFLFLFDTGCRQSEARALQWDDIDFDNKLILIKHNFSGIVFRDIPKNKKEEFVPMKESVEKLLLNHPRTLRSDFVFTFKGKPYYESKLGKIWRKARRVVGIDDVNLHEGSRHSLASQLVSKGVALEIIGKILRHSDSRSTQIYSHVHLDAMRRAMED